MARLLEINTLSTRNCTAPEKSTEYDDTLVRQIISRIGIYKDEKIKIVFIDGTEMMENLPPKIR